MPQVLTKSEAREAWKKIRAGEVRNSQSVCDAILRHPRFLKAPRVALYLARSWEVDLLSLWRARPEACVFPVVISSSQMEFRPLGKQDELRPGYRGLLEPGPGPAYRSWVSADLILVPGVALNRRGERVGSGAGFYDRFLATVPAEPWGVCWESQMVASPLAQEATDVRMKAVCTEQGIVEVGAGHE